MQVETRGRNDLKHCINGTNLLHIINSEIDYKKVDYV